MFVDLLCLSFFCLIFNTFKENTRFSGANALSCSAANNGDCSSKYCCTPGKACYQCGGNSYECSNEKLGLRASQDEDGLGQKIEAGA